MPLPNHAMLPPDWQARHAPTIAATFRSSGILTRLSDQQGTRDPIAGKTTFATPYPVYEGAARIQSRSGGATARGPGGSAVPVAARIVTVGSYLLVLPADSQPAKVGDLWETAECPDSPDLIGRVLKIVEVAYADVAWQRSYGCDLHEPTPRG